MQLGAAEAAEPLFPDAATGLAEGCAVCVDLGGMAGARVPWGISPVDLTHGGLGLRWTPAPPVELRLRYEYLVGRWPDGSITHDHGDLRLAAAARLWQGGGGAPSGWLDWWVKLPNTEDETGLGTDEADTNLRLLLRWRGPRWAATAGAGIAILGDPTAFAAQDDALIVLLAGVRRGERVDVLSRVEGRVWSPDNPTDLGWSIGLEGGDRLRVGAEASLGVVGGDPRAGGRAWVAWTWACGAAPLVPPPGGA
ncbi:MAG: hypothetical protein H6741_26510 [Alphaproteobacteria bacterium]|nr:hypothetical protein [Alphaproteobacteria bacterium]MCB9796262.1 hypothetical protein [Alphaproteobacteria bacterium]